MASLKSTFAALLCGLALAGCWSYISTEAQQRFQGREGRFTVTVYPVHVMKGGSVVHDGRLARKLVAMLTEENLADAMPGNSPVKTQFKWGANQAKMAEQSATAFAAVVKETGIQTEYALLAEILCNPQETEVLGVHFYLSDRAGRLADGGLTNSHWEEFQQVKPKDRQGGYEVLVRMLRKQWKPG